MVDIQRVLKSTTRMDVVLGKRSMQALKVSFMGKRTSSPCSEILKNRRIHSLKNGPKGEVSRLNPSLLPRRINVSQIFIIISIYRWTDRLLKKDQSLAATKNRSRDWRAIVVGYMTWKVYGDVESWLGTIRSHQLRSSDDLRAARPRAVKLKAERS